MHWLQCMEVMDAETIAKRLWIYRQIGQRLPERPRKHWMDQSNPEARTAKH